MPVMDVEYAITEIQSRETVFKTALESDAEAEHRFKIGKAKAYLNAEGTEKAREATAILETSDLYLDHLKKKAVKEFTKESLRDAQDALTARQSILKYERETDFGASRAGA